MATLKLILEKDEVREAVSQYLVREGLGKLSDQTKIFFEEDGSVTILQDLAQPARAPKPRTRSRKGG